MKKWCSDKFFEWVHKNHLIYNACWEDPRLDRKALQINDKDQLMVITSAGCNVLDYLLDEPNRIHAVDVNPRQNALLELKLAGLKALDFDSFFQIFGRGFDYNFEQIYKASLRPLLPEFARNYWDWCLHYFNGSQNKQTSFYFRGTSGLFARFVNHYLRAIKARGVMGELFKAKTIKEQKDLYFNFLDPRLWKRSIRWAMNRSSVLTMLGVPRAQRETIEKYYGEGGIFSYVRDCIESVFTKISLRDNYFWSLYFDGYYTKERCPEYLRRKNFPKLKKLADRVQTHNTTVTSFLNHSPEKISRFILLDHMDWLNEANPRELQSEWQAIVKTASPRARLIWRSGGLNVDFVDPVRVRLGSNTYRMGELLRYENALSNTLHRKDRVHTYGSFYVSQLVS